MKSINNKNIVIVLILITLVVLGSFSFLTYEEYNKFESSKKDTQKIILIEKTQGLINKIKKERVYSALYMGTGKNSFFKKLKNYRSETDREISELKLITKNKASLLTIVLNLKEARAKVETLNEDYMNTFNEIYHINIIKPLNLNLREIKTKKGSIDYMLNLMTELNLLTENIALENTGIIYILSTEKKLLKKDLEVWNEIIFKDQLPDFSKIRNRKIVRELNSIINAEDYLKIGKKERVSVFHNAIDGKYKITSADWFKEIKVKIEKLAHVQNILLSYSKIKIEDNINIKKEELIRLSSITLALLLFLLVMVIIYNNVARDTKLFEETLKEIERLLNKEQQKELKKLIEERDINKIYLFLIETIKEANMSKDLFLANMSHEIRTPLNGIVGFTQLLKEANLNEEEREYISIIEHSSDNLLTIVNSILDLSKIKANKIEIEVIDFDPVNEFENTIESYVTKAEEKGINLNTFIDPKLPTKIMGDPTKISQVIVNLISNAIKFTDKDGDVSISIEKIKEDKGQILLKFDVSDTGIGVSEEQKEKIFDEFSQADVSTSRKFGGTGLGLAISKNLITLMGGRLSIESIEGEGSTFSFSLFLDKSSSAKEREFNNLKEKTISFIGKEDNKLFNNIDTYLSSMKNSLSSNKESDIVFINYNKETIKNDLDTSAKKIVLISKDVRDDISADINNIDMIIYKPINLTKVKNAMYDIFSLNKDLIEEEEKQELYKFNNVNVLVAEDNSINQKLIKNLLQSFGIDPDIADNGEIAYNMKKQKEYDLIFMDIQMPVMGGIEATDSILRYEMEKNKRHSIIVALTANALQGDREKYLAAGMDDYLSKPLEVDKLNEILFKYFPNNTTTKPKIEKTSIKEKIVAIETKPETEVQQETVVKRKIVENSTIKEHVSVLIYHPISLSSRILGAIFKQLNMTVDIVNDENKMLDKLETTTYDYVIFEATPFLKVSCLISDIIKDAGAEPLAIIYNKQDNTEFCCKLIDEKVSKEVLVKELGIK